MMQGYIVRANCGIYFLLKKHMCFQCGCIIERRKREIIVNSESEEAKNYDFEIADMYATGDVKFVTYYFQCPRCGTSYEIHELKQLYKLKKLEKKQNKKMQKKLKKMR